jgi:glutathione peroxidase
MSKFYKYSAKTISGKEISMNEYKGKTVVVVNTASKCGFTPQFKGLQEMYDKHKDNGLVILGFPCNQFKKQDPAENSEISEFCQLNYGVTFQMFEKIDVNGIKAHPLFDYLKSELKGFILDAIKWNFTKFVINKDGKPVKRFAPKDSIEKVEKYLENEKLV